MVAPSRRSLCPLPWRLPLLGFQRPDLLCFYGARPFLCSSSSPILSSSLSLAMVPSRSPSARVPVPSSPGSRARHPACRDGLPSPARGAPFLSLGRRSAQSQCRGPSSLPLRVSSAPLPASCSPTQLPPSAPSPAPLRCRCFLVQRRDGPGWARSGLMGARR